MLLSSPPRPYFTTSAIPLWIRRLLKTPRPLLSMKDRALLDRHVEIGVAILQKSGWISAEVCTIVWQHHESVTGNGFPRGLKAQDIHPLARLLHLADEFCSSVMKSGGQPGVSTPARRGAYEKQAGTRSKSGAFLATNSNPQSRQCSEQKVTQQSILWVTYLRACASRNRQRISLASVNLSNSLGQFLIHPGDTTPSVNCLHVAFNFSYKRMNQIRTQFALIAKTCF